VKPTFYNRKWIVSPNAHEFVKAMLNKAIFRSWTALRRNTMGNAPSSSFGHNTLGNRNLVDKVSALTKESDIA